MAKAFWESTFPRMPDIPDDLEVTESSSNNEEPLASTTPVAPSPRHPPPHSQRRNLRARNKKPVYKEASANSATNVLLEIECSQRSMDIQAVSFGTAQHSSTQEHVSRVIPQRNVQRSPNVFFQSLLDSQNHSPAADLQDKDREHLAVADRQYGTQGCLTLARHHSRGSMPYNDDFNLFPSS
ncbi:hypothetical protein LZ31DRAFT_590878 [Colletotrichum somersetense]|nr:hypothetical protein LZ31DRAFT_590878 [Colletotrichum somersetense]